jgi:hypothetical protein
MNRHYTITLSRSTNGMWSISTQTTGLLQYDWDHHPSPRVSGVSADVAAAAARDAVKWAELEAEETAKREARIEAEISKV